MAVLFSKVTMTADNGSSEEFLVGGIPDCEADLEGWTAYDDFLEDNPDAIDMEVEVDSYVYGEGECSNANEYEIAAFTRRGEDFLNHPDVQITQRSGFIILLDPDESEGWEVME